MAPARLLMWAFLFVFFCQVTCNDKTALIIIDVQNCFTQGGTLAVTDGDAVIDVINRIRSTHGAMIDLVVFSQDWHCSDHVSFASQFPKNNLFDIVNLGYSPDGNLCWNRNVTSKYAVNCTEIKYEVGQTLWPDHCVIGTEDADLHSRLTFKNATDIVVRKGYRCHVDSYSAFFDNGGFEQTELQQKLQAAGITAVFITGLAQDFCVYWTAKDAKNYGYKTFVVYDATRPVSAEGGRAALADMVARDIRVIHSNDIADVMMEMKGGSDVSLPSVFCLLLSGLLALLLK